MGLALAGLRWGGPSSWFRVSGSGFRGVAVSRLWALGLRLATLGLAVALTKVPLSLNPKP